MKVSVNNTMLLQLASHTCLLLSVLSTCGISVHGSDLDHHYDRNKNPIFYKSGYCKITTPQAIRRIPECTMRPSWYCLEAIAGEEIVVNFTAEISSTCTSRICYLTPMAIYNGFEKPLGRSTTFKRQRDSYSLVTRNAIIGSDILIYVLKAAKSYTVCDMVYINVELRYEREPLRWLVEDQRFWYHIKRDVWYGNATEDEPVFSLSANSEAVGYPRPYKYILSTDNGTILVDLYIDNGNHLTGRVYKDDLVGVESLTLTAYAPSLQPLNRTVRISEMFPARVPSSQEQEFDYEVLWMVSAICEMVAVGVIIITHCVAQRKRILARFCGNHQAGNEVQMTGLRQPDVNVYVSNFMSQQPTGLAELESCAQEHQVEEPDHSDDAPQVGDALTSRTESSGNLSSNDESDMKTQLDTKLVSSEAVDEEQFIDLLKDSGFDTLEL